MNLGVQLRVYRKSKGHSVQKVSELTGIPADRIYKWEKGTRPSDAEDLLKIRAYMGGQSESAPKNGDGELEIGPSTPLPLGNITRTLADYIYLLEFYNKTLSAAINEGLVELKSNLKDVYDKVDSANQHAVADRHAMMVVLGEMSGKGDESVLKEADSVERVLQATKKRTGKDQPRTSSKQSSP